MLQLNPTSSRKQADIIYSLSINSAHLVIQLRNKMHLLGNREAAEKLQGVIDLLDEIGFTYLDQE